MDTKIPSHNSQQKNKNTVTGWTVAFKVSDLLRDEYWSQGEQAPVQAECACQRSHGRIEVDHELIFHQFPFHFPCFHLILYYRGII